MNADESPHLIAVRSSDFRMKASTASARDAHALAEALYEARPAWRISIDGRDAVFSREGKVVDLVSAPSHRAGTSPPDGKEYAS